MKELKMMKLVKKVSYNGEEVEYKVLRAESMMELSEIGLSEHEILHLINEGMNQREKEAALMYAKALYNTNDMMRRLGLKGKVQDLIKRNRPEGG